MRDTAAQPTFDVTSLGESMLRLSVARGERLQDATDLRVHVGGSESNTLAALAQIGRQCAWVSRLPDNAVGRLVLRRIQAAGVETEYVVMASEGRVGTYYFEPSVHPRVSSVIYDRANSAICNLDSADVPWSALLDTHILHLSGITPALGPACLRLYEEALERASSDEVKVSFDVNYRASLWSPDAAARTLRPFVERADVVFCSLRDVRSLYGSENDPHSALQMLRERTAAQTIVVSLGAAGAIGVHQGEVIEAEGLAVEIIDRPGAGDALAAGVLDGLLDNNFPAGLRQGVVLSALALTQEGDMLTTSREDLRRYESMAEPSSILR